MRLSPVQSERKDATEILSLECRSIVPRLLSKFHKAFAKQSSDEIPRLLFVYKSRKQRRATGAGQKLDISKAVAQQSGHRVARLV